MSNATERFRDLVAACPAWQTITGATGTESEKREHARERTYVSQSPTDLAPPFLVVDPPEDDFETVGTGASMTYRFGGQMFFRFVLAVPSEATESAQSIAIETTRTTLRDEMLARAGSVTATDTFIELRALRLDPGMVPPRDDFSGQWWISGTADWGVGA